MPPVTLASRPTIVPSMTMPESSSLFCTATVARTLSDPEYPGYAPTSATALRDVWYVLVGGFAGVFGVGVGASVTVCDNALGDGVGANVVGASEGIAVSTLVWLLKISSS